jgi:dTDP-4-dehydrorhamnose reductase
MSCARHGVRLVHFSTNFVFDGSGTRPFTEEDVPRPLGAYARSKLEGERLVLELMPAALVVRSSGLFGSRGSAVKGGSFPERILGRVEAGEAVRVVDDQRLNPTYTADLAAGVVALVQREQRGVVHLVAEGCCSYWEMAVETVRLAGFPVAVDKTSSAALGAAALRPANGCLASVRVGPLRHWQDGLSAWWQAWSALRAVRPR